MTFASKLDAALAYAALGWAVFPLTPGSKKPMAGSRGFKDATKDSELVRALWGMFPDANIGVATGEISGISVLDCDEKTWDAKYGITQTLAVLVKEHGTLPQTPTQETWSGGKHAIFAYTPSASNAAGAYGRCLDGKNDGGYIVVPPSTVADEGREGAYTWLDGKSPFDCALAPMPAWLLERVQPSGTFRRVTGWKATKTIREIAGEARNNALTSLAGSMRRRDTSTEAVRAALLAENESFPEPLPVAEVETIVGSAEKNFAPAEVEDLDARYTDKANAERLAQTSGDRIRYCDDLASWFYFDGVRWVRASRYGIAPFVTDLAKGLYHRAASESDDDKRKRFGMEAAKLESARVVRNVIELAQTLPELRIELDAFDTHGYLLNLENGTLDLRTGELLRHEPGHFLRKLAPVVYDPDAHSSLWENTVKLVTCGDDLLTAFLQRVLGYALTGDTREDSFFVFYGPGGANGKTSVLEPMAAMLGDYATTLRVHALLAGYNETIPHDYADLLGARFVVTSELPQGKRYNESTLKQITGGDTITACHKYGNNFHFAPSFKLFMSTNFPPVFSGGDDALWRRAKTVPFRFSFKTYAGADKTAKDRLKEPEHLAGILAWAVRGCLAWQANGLQLPEAVAAETRQHRKDVDMIQAFVDERCATTESPSAVPVSGQELYRVYRAWSRDQPMPQALSATGFESEMMRAGYALVAVHRTRRWGGLRLRGDQE